MQKGLITGLLALAFPMMSFAAPTDYTPQSVGAGNPELHIQADGTITLKSGRVDQIAGSTFYLGLKWGTLPMRFTMKTGTRTAVIKRYGGSATVSQIKIGDYLDIEGEFFVGSDFFGMDALRVKDWSLQEENETFLGVISAINPDYTFTLKTPTQKSILVKFATTTTIKKGVIELPANRLAVGNTILLAEGVYDYVSNTLTARRMLVFQQKAEFAARNFEGVLKQIESPRAPTTITVTVGGVDYTVRLSERTSLLKKNRAAAEFTRFVVGDIVRFYGAIREEEKTLRDENVVDAEIVRNLNL